MKYILLILLMIGCTFKEPVYKKDCNMACLTLARIGCGIPMPQKCIDACGKQFREDGKISRPEFDPCTAEAMSCDDLLRCVDK